MTETLLDVKGISCPLPVLKANRTLRGMAAGERLRVLATDRAAVADFQDCPGTGHALLAWSDEAGVFSFVIRRRAEDPRKRAADVTTVLITHPACLEHDTGPSRPETAERLRAVLAALEAPEFPTCWSIGSDGHSGAWTVCIPKPMWKGSSPSAPIWASR